MGVKVSNPPKSFGSWEVRSNNTVYQASHDGIVCCYNTVGGSNITGFTDGSNPPGMTRCWIGVATSGVAPAITFAVKKKDYWKVAGANTVFWIPLK